MGAETLLYGYGLVCLSMLAYNLVYSIYLRAGDRRLRRRVERLQRRIEVQLRAAQPDPAGAPRPIQVRHLTWMNRCLSRVSNLLAFDRLLDGRADDAAFREYLRQLQPVFLYLATVYRRREDTQAAYFCHFLARHQLQRHMQMDEIQRALLGFLRKPSLYCRVNALKALCAFGSPETVAEALLELQRRPDTLLHEKVITECLLAYTGDSRALIARLWERFDRFTVQLQRAVLDYIRFRSGGSGAEMAAILRDPGRDKELRFAAIRYFGRYPDPAVRELLLDFVRDGDPLRWEYAAIAATALAGYGGDDVVDALLQALRSPNWYVRYNASASLEAHGLQYEDMLAVLHGDDRYAREMLTYRIQSRELEARAAARPAEREEVAAGA